MHTSRWASWPWVCSKHLGKRSEKAKRTRVVVREENTGISDCRGWVLLQRVVSLRGPGYAHDIWESSWSWTWSNCPGKDFFVLLERSLENHSKAQLKTAHTSLCQQFLSTGILIHLGSDSLGCLKFPTYGQVTEQWYCSGNTFDKTQAFDCPLLTQSLLTILFAILRKKIFSCLQCIGIIKLKLFFVLI